MTAPKSPLFFDADAKFVNLEAALKPIARVVRVLTDPLIPGGALPTWLSAVSGTMSYPTSGSEFTGANSIGWAKNTSAATNGSSAAIRGLNSRSAGNLSFQPNNFVALAWTLEGLTFDADTGFDFQHGFPGSTSTVGGAQIFQPNGQVNAEIRTYDASNNLSRTPRTVADAVTTSGSQVLTSATAAFVAGDVGQPIGGNNGGPLIPGAVISSVDSATQVHVSIPATATASSVSISIGQQNGFRAFAGSGGGRWRRNITALWLPTDGWFYTLMDDQVVSEVNLNAAQYYAPGSTAFVQTSVTVRDGVAHSMTWEKAQLIIAHN